MKKLLSILAVLGVSAVGTTSVIACDKTESNNLSRVKTIAAPAKLAVNNITQVKKEEIKKALDPNVLKAVQDVVKTAQANDFEYEIYADNKGKELNTFNLKEVKFDLYVQITPAKDKTLVIGKSGYIKVTLPKNIDEKMKNISYLSAPDQSVLIKVSNPLSVTKTDLEAVNKDKDIIKAFLDSIQKNLPGTEVSEFKIENDGKEGNYSEQKIIKVTAKANVDSEKIYGEFYLHAKVKAESI